MLNVYIGEEKAVHNERLAEGLPSGVHEVHTKNEIRHSKLPVPMNKNLELEYKVQVPYMNYSNILGKHQTVCNII